MDVSIIFFRFKWFKRKLHLDFVSTGNYLTSKHSVFFHWKTIQHFVTACKDIVLFQWPSSNYLKLFCKDCSERQILFSCFRKSFEVYDKNWRYKIWRSRQRKTATVVSYKILRSICWRCDKSISYATQLKLKLSTFQ